MDLRITQTTLENKLEANAEEVIDIQSNNFMNTGISSLSTIVLNKNQSAWNNMDNSKDNDLNIGVDRSAFFSIEDKVNDENSLKTFPPEDSQNFSSERKSLNNFDLSFRIEDENLIDKSHNLDQDTSEREIREITFEKIDEYEEQSPFKKTPLQVLIIPDYFKIESQDNKIEPFEEKENENSQNHNSQVKANEDMQSPIRNEGVDNIDKIIHSFHNRQPHLYFENFKERQKNVKSKIFKPNETIKPLDSFSKFKMRSPIKSSILVKNNGETNSGKKLKIRKIVNDLNKNIPNIKKSNKNKENYLSQCVIRKLDTDYNSKQYKKFTCFSGIKEAPKSSYISPAIKETKSQSLLESTIRNTYNKVKNILNIGFY